MQVPYLERAHEISINSHHSTCIVIVTTIVGSREEGHQLTTSKEFVAILNNLRERGGRGEREGGRGGRDEGRERTAIEAGSAELSPLGGLVVSRKGRLSS